MLAEALFWLSVCTVTYVYVGHPCILYVWARLRPRRWMQHDVNLPIAIFISAFNEEKNIGKKIRNLLEQDYRGPFTIIVANDGSGDRTAEIVRSFSDARVVLYDFKQNRGKAAMQNEIVPTLDQEVVIFSDATSVWQRNAITTIARNFHDLDVGCVAVDLCFISEREGLVQKGQGAYWKYERFLRRYGALVRTNIVASGTTYAIRRSLFSPILPDIGEDLSNPLQIAMTGQRVIFDPDVVVAEISSSSHASEIRMRKRIAVRNITGLVSYIKFLSPRYGFAAYQLLVHKYLRVFCWIPMVAALCLSCALRHTVPYGYLFLIQIGLYTLAVLGYLSARVRARSRFAYLAYYFVLLNYTCMIGLFYYLRGVRRPTWTPDR